MANKTLNTRIVIRNDTAQHWSSENPVLMKGEIGIVFDPSAGAANAVTNFKIGDGVTAWNSLPLMISEYDPSSLLEKIEALQDALPIEDFDAEHTVKDALDALGVDVAALEEKVGDQAVTATIASAIDALDLPNTYATLVSFNALTTRVTATEVSLNDFNGRISANAAAIATLNAGAGITGSVANSIQVAMEAEVARANGAYDPKGAAGAVAATIGGGFTSQSTVASHISALETKVGDQTVSESVVAGINAAMTTSGTIGGAIKNVQDQIGNGFSASQNITGAIQSINEAITSLSGSHFKVVPTLPATGEPNIIYLVPDDNVGYKEWIYVSDIHSWEEIGDTYIDLSDYYTKSEIDQSILDPTQQQSLAHRLGVIENDYITASALAAACSVTLASANAGATTIAQGKVDEALTSIATIYVAASDYLILDGGVATPTVAGS